MKWTGGTGRAAAGLVAAALLAAATGALSAAPASAATDWNDYTATLPAYVTGPTPFQVVVDGPDAVCSMTFNDTTLTAAPWAFTVTPKDLEDWRDTVDISLCDGSSDWARLEASVPFRFSGTIATPGYPASVTNRTTEPATVSVTNAKGQQVSALDLAPDASGDITVPRSKTTSVYTVTATTASGVAMQHRLIAPYGWTMIGGFLDGPNFAPCSTVTWSYDATHEPKSANTFKKDIKPSLDRLAKETGLTFVYTNDFAHADLRYHWDPSMRGSAGMGGTDGDITFSTTNYWPRNKYAGFKPFTPYSKGNVRYTGGPAGRGWLIIHETMHALGFGHVDNEKAIMAPINRGQGAFTKGDLQGLHSLYPSAQCAA